MLNIAKQIYSGWNGTSVSVFDLPEAEVIPFGTSNNEKKRLETITKKYSVLKEHENIPLPGYTLYKNGRKNYGSADPTWLVIDPRGYLTRITNDNLEMILHVTGITEGLIQEKCVWARDDSQTKMILVPVTSEKYLEAVQNTELLDSKINIKSVQIGDEVLLQNQLTGTYMGALSLYSSFDSYGNTHNPQTFLRRQIVRLSTGKYFYQTDLKILKVVKATDKPMSKEESVKILNNEIAAGTAFFSNSPHISAARYYSVRGMIKHVSVNAVPKPNMVFEELTKDQARKLFSEALAICDPGMLMLENAKGKYLIDFPYSFSSGKTVAVNAFSAYRIQDAISGCDTLQDVEDKNPRGYGYGYYSSSSRVTEVHSLDNFTKFYKIVKHVKKETYV